MDLAITLGARELPPDIAEYLDRGKPIGLKEVAA
jgi:hypothetical protein